MSTCDGCGCHQRFYQLWKKYEKLTKEYNKLVNISSKELKKE